MAFVTQDVKDEACYTQPGSKLVDLFTQLVRGACINPTLVNLCLAESVEDTIVLAFQTRDIRGGKGERKLFRDLLSLILKEKPEFAYIIALVPEYGRWDDVWSFMGVSPDVNMMIDHIVLSQFRLDQECETPSLLTKWLPREGSKKSSLALHFANILFPLTPVNQRLRAYRKTVAFLNKRINTTEIKMCSGSWSSISPDSVPAQLFKRNLYAFLNKKRVVLGKKVIRLQDSRYPMLSDRVACSNNFNEYMSGRFPSFTKPLNVETPYESLRALLVSPRYHPVRMGLKG